MKFNYSTIILAIFCLYCESISAQSKTIRIGVIGLDTSHAPAFASRLNDPKAAEDLAGCKVIAAYPHGSKDIESSASRIPKYTAEFKEMGIEITESIPDLLQKVDCVLLETNDGRLHLEQAKLVIDAKKTLFIDKPITASLEDAIEIFEYAKKKDVAVFSSSSLRYMQGAQDARNGKHGKVLGVSTYSPCALEKTHPDLFWYGIHGVEILYTVMGPGCERVTRSSSKDFELVTGVWKDGRIATFRGIRAGKSGYGGTAFCEKGIVNLGAYGGYRPLLVEIVKFFKTGKAPVDPAETIELYAFMAAADKSKSEGGKPVRIVDLLEK